MAVIQDLVTALSIHKQADMATAVASSADFIRFSSQNQAVPFPDQKVESNAGDIGVGPFGDALVKLTRGLNHPLEFDASTKTMAIIGGLGLGKVVKTTEGDGFKYVCTRDTDPSALLPVASFYAGLGAGTAGEILDCMNIGVGVEEFSLELISAVQRTTAKITAALVGSGRVNANAGFTVPAATPLNLLNFGSVTTMSFAGLDLSTGYRLNNLKFTYKNNIPIDKCYRIGAGLSQDGFAVMARIIRGRPTVEVTFSIEVAAGSGEQAAFLALTGGVMDIKLTGPNMGPGATNPEYIRIQAPESRILGIPFGVDTDTVVYNVTGSIITPSSGSPVTLTVATPLDEVLDADA